jgi:hypothetical protein
MVSKQIQPYWYLQQLTYPSEWNSVSSEGGPVPWGVSAFAATNEGGGWG